jgi:hypothetical protein
MRIESLKVHGTTPIRADVPAGPRCAGTMRLSETPAQFRNEQNSTASRTCGGFGESLSTKCVRDSSRFIAGHVANRTSSEDTQTTCGTRSRPLAGGTFAGSDDFGDSTQPHALISAAASAAQQLMPQAVGSSTCRIACTGMACASSAKMRMMERSRVMGSSVQTHDALNGYAKNSPMASPFLPSLGWRLLLHDPQPA